MRFFTLGSSKIEVFEIYFFDIVIAQNDHPRYVQHVLGRIFLVFHPISVSGGWGGVSSKGWVQTLLMQFFTLGTSKTEVFEKKFVTF